MAATVFPLLCHQDNLCFSLPAYETCEPAKGDPQHPPYYSHFVQVIHSTLKVHEPLGSLQPSNGAFEVTVYNGTDNTKIPFIMKSTDTIGKLKKAYIKKRPHMIGSLNLVFNGKPVQAEKTLGELGVKTGATFITFQRCIGG
uniref:Ubiquitin-like domain-containing protein n=1 Tax=Pygocentrus nattereri TaxID=42514 RepID=A0AAR2J715_PYGNA